MNCPILSAGYTASEPAAAGVRLRRIHCDEENCALWDRERECCSLNSQGRTGFREQLINVLGEIMRRMGGRS